VSVGLRPLPLLLRTDCGQITISAVSAITAITATMANNDNVMARFLFAILEQKCLKDVSQGGPSTGVGEWARY
jgi:hypothetical protein